MGCSRRRDGNDARGCFDTQSKQRIWNRCWVRHLRHIANWLLRRSTVCSARVDFAKGVQIAPLADDCCTWSRSRHHSSQLSLATDVGDGSAIFAGVPVGIIAATAMSGVFAATGIAFSVVRFRDPFSSLGFVKTSGFKPYLFAVAMWIVGLSVLMFWVQALVWFGVDSLVPPDTAKQALDEADGNIVATIILVGILGPMAEEIFFRGYVLPGLTKKFGIIWALVISSVVFGLFHIDPGAIVPTFALGLMLGWVYLKTGSIWPAMFAHGLHNTVAVLVAKYVTVN